MTKNIKPVTGSEVREWLRSDKGQAALVKEGVTTQVGQRGRHKPEHIAVFNKVNKGKHYETDNKAVEAPAVTVKVDTIDSIGRKTKRDVTITTAEARTLLGQPTNRKGRLSRATLALALAAVEADKVAGQFTKAV